MSSGSPPPEPQSELHFQALQKYYASLESGLGYRLILGDTRHYGFYTPNTLWPFPIGAALRRMEDRLISTLGLPAGSTVLDCGCGVGHVAIHLVKKAGYRVRGIDIVDSHLEKARRNVRAEGLDDGRVTVGKGDYHHLDRLSDVEFDGVYTMETFVHAVEPEKATAEFFRVLRPGGTLAMHEYDHLDLSTQSEGAQTSFANINKYSAMPANARFNRGELEKFLEDAGFEDIVVRDLTENVLPMVRWFYVLAVVPYFIFMMLGLQRFFINTVAGYAAYRYRDTVRYIAVSAKKPRVTVWKD